MSKPPQDAKTISGLEEYGIDRNGLWVFFGFKIKDDKAVTLHCNYKGLNECIMYLKTIAKEAESRRIKVDLAAQLDVEETQPNFVRQLDFDADVTGNSASLSFTTQDGNRKELQIPYDILRNMRDYLPGLLNEMDRLQAMRQ